jgi:hypothetical protein
VLEDGEFVESTDDWYAQDLDGNIWYMGEIAQNFEDGQLTDLDGSWESGVNGAKAGILIKAMPIIDETLRQEFLLGEAEDMGQTISLSADGESGESAGIICNTNCLQVFEYNALESDSAEHKYYYPGVGKIVSIDLDNGEREELVSFSVQ